MIIYMGISGNYNKQNKIKPTMTTKKKNILSSPALPKSSLNVQGIQISLSWKMNEQNSSVNKRRESHNEDPLTFCLLYFTSALSHCVQTAHLSTMSLPL